MSDLIERSAVIDLIDKYTQDMSTDYWTANYGIPSGVFEDEIMELPSKQSKPQWIPCSERLPEDRKSVIVCYRCWLQFSQKFAYAIVIGWRASKFGVKAEVFTDWDGGFDYNKEQDENYIPEGWYEFTTQGNGDLMDWYINAEVIAWMPLPEPYMRGEQNDSISD